MRLHLELLILRKATFASKLISIPESSNEQLRPRAAELLGIQNIKLQLGKRR
jgi:hypothetical protein